MVTASTLKYVRDSNLEGQYKVVSIKYSLYLNVLSIKELLPTLNVLKTIVKMIIYIMQ